MNDTEKVHLVYCIVGNNILLPDNNFPAVIDIDASVCGLSIDAATIREVPIVRRANSRIKGA